MAQREYDEQCALFRFLSLHERQYPLLRWVFAIPNGLFLSPKTAMKAKAQGVKSGVWDVMVPVPILYPASGFIVPGLWLELKIKPNKLTPSQIEFQRHAEAETYRCIVAYSWIEGANAILDYLNIHDAQIRDAIKINEKVTA